MIDITEATRKLSRELTMPVELVTSPSDSELRIHVKPLKNAKGAVMVIVRRERLTERAFREWKGDQNDVLSGFVAYALNN